MAGELARRTKDSLIATVKRERAKASELAEESQRFADIAMEGAAIGLSGLTYGFATDRYGKDGEWKIMGRDARMLGLIAGYAGGIFDDYTGAAAGAFLGLGQTSLALITFDKGKELNQALVKSQKAKADAARAAGGGSR